MKTIHDYIAVIIGTLHNASELRRGTGGRVK